MKNRAFTTLGSVVLASALMIGAVAQERDAKKLPMNPAPKTPVAVKCTPKGNSDTATEVTLQNTTPAPIAQGTKISWASNAEITNPNAIVTNATLINTKNLLFILSCLLAFAVAL